MNYNEITRLMYVGEKFTPDDLKTLKELGVGVVLNLMEEDNLEASWVKEAGIDYRYVPVEDGMAAVLSQLAVESEFAASRMAKDQEVYYIHCSYGVGRSPYFASAVLMCLGMSSTEAANFVKSKRLVTNLSPWQVISLEDLERYWKGQKPLEEEPDPEKIKKFCTEWAGWLENNGYSEYAEEIKDRFLRVTAHKT